MHLLYSRLCLASAVHNSNRQIVRPTTFCADVSSICVSSVWDKHHKTLLVPRILRRLPDVCTVSTALFMLLSCCCDDSLVTCKFLILNAVQFKPPHSHSSSVRNEQPHSPCCIEPRFGSSPDLLIGRDLCCHCLCRDVRRAGLSFVQIHVL
jgi:hypothetical protein